REVDEALERVERAGGRLEHVVGPDHVHAHRADGALEHRLDAGDRGAVDEVGRAGGELRDEIGVEHVAVVEGEVRVLEQLRAAQRVAVQVVDRDDLIAFDELTRERRADEARAAGDDDPLTVEHDGEAYAPATRAGRGRGGGRRAARGPRPAANRGASRR